MSKDIAIEPSWKKILMEEFTKPYFSTLREKIRHAYQTTTVYPPPQHLFEAFNTCPFSQVKVVILGQDPYHSPGQAHGLSFSVPPQTPAPPSLQNIQKEIRADIGELHVTDGNLIPWAKQGVLLLNTTLSVRDGAPTSHQGLGWEIFTDTVIKTISNQKNNVVFLLWGKHAINKRVLIDENKHLVLTAPHPSPLSAYRGFFGCQHFSQTNHYLKQTKQVPIKW